MSRAKKIHVKTLKKFTRAKFSLYALTISKQLLVTEICFAEIHSLCVI